MLTEIRKSINAILYERVTSPLFGTLTISWLIWNWKIVFLILFVSENSINSDKISYICTHYNSLWHLVYGPLISCVLLLTVIPFVSNGAYWLSLKFQKWKIEKKNEIEKKQLLTIEQSLQLRTQIAQQQESFEKLIKDKDEEILILKQQISEMGKKAGISGAPVLSTNLISDDQLNKEYLDFKNDEKMFNQFETVINSINGANSLFNRLTKFLPEDDARKVISYYDANGIIEKSKKYSPSSYVYDFTQKGRAFYKKHVNNQP